MAQIHGIDMSGSETKSPSPKSKVFGSVLGSPEDYEGMSEDQKKGIEMQVWDGLSSIFGKAAFPVDVINPGQ